MEAAPDFVRSLQDEFNRHGELLLMLRYTQSLIMQMAQTTVCNRHSVDQQLCCWLLLSLDRPRPEQLRCECQAVVRKETDRLLPCLPSARAPLRPV
ncbi:MAG TPA: hypothetical protein VLI06_14080 [Solimonas sp.]|nr:hypothetical protein [Solimonas sp.]